MQRMIPMRVGSGREPLVVEIPDGTPVEARMRVTVETAVQNKVNLEGAYLEGAYLLAAYLDGADLEVANLESANLLGANLQGANLRGASLDGADFEAANLETANLESGRLRGASLRGANLQGADFLGADLECANLRGADLRGAIFSPPDDPSWSAIRDDLTRVLDQAQPEIPALLAALREGRIDGRVYDDGECGCPIGTIAIARGVDPYTLPFRNASSPIERLFLGISRGDTPETNPIAKIVEAWIVAYQQEHGLLSTSPQAGSQ